MQLSASEADGIALPGTEALLMQKKMHWYDGNEEELH